MDLYNDVIVKEERMLYKSGARSFHQKHLKHQYKCFKSTEFLEMPADVLIKVPLQCCMCCMRTRQSTLEFNPYLNPPPNVKREAKLVCLQINLPNETALSCFLLPEGIKHLVH